MQQIEEEVEQRVALVSGDRRTIAFPPQVYHLPLQTWRRVRRLASAPLVFQMRTVLWVISRIRASQRNRINIKRSRLHHFNLVNVSRCSSNLNQDHHQFSHVTLRCSQSNSRSSKFSLNIPNNCIHFYCSNNHRYCREIPRQVMTPRMLTIHMAEDCALSSTTKPFTRTNCTMKKPSLDSAKGKARKWTR